MLIVMEDDIPKVITPLTEVEHESADVDLKELCDAASIQLPTYNYEQVTSSEVPMFESTCKLLDHITTGTGTSKKFAKKIASAHMLKYLISTVPSYQDKYINRKMKRRNTHLIPEVQRFRATNEDATKCLIDLCIRTGSTIRKNMISQPHSKCIITTDYGTVEGYGSSENQAKDTASAKMLRLIEQTMQSGKSERSTTINGHTKESGG